MINRKHELRITGQAKVPNISRGTAYYFARATSATGFGQFTAVEFTCAVFSRGCNLSMDGKGA